MTTRPATSDPALGEHAVALLDALLAISADLDNHAVLRRIVQSACELTHSRYGALAVLGHDRSLVEFVTYGMDQRTADAIGRLPSGEGLIGLALSEPVRLDDLTAHPQAVGLPEHHPPLRTLLALPVTIRGTVYANLLLSEKEDGTPYDVRDEQLVRALTTVAAIVIENTLAYGLSERRRRWLEKFGELNEMLLPPISLDVAFQRIADAVLTASDARAVAVVQVPPTGRIVTAALSGEVRELDEEGRRQTAVASRRVAEAGVAIDIDLEDDRVAFFVPLRAHLTLPGVLLAEFDRHHLTDALEERELLASFADQAGLALDRAQALQDRAEMAVISDRDRIARDLHDVVIQRLFAAGLHMQKTRSMASDPVLGERLDLSMRDLDQTIRDIRQTIFELQTHQQNPLRSEIRDLVREYVPVLGFAPTVQMRGPIDTSLGQQHHLVAVLREALSNIARHSGATNATVDLEVGADRLRLQVSDNGVGLPEERKESGLANAKRRAQMLGGTVELTTNEPSGTVFTWVVPLS